MDANWIVRLSCHFMALEENVCQILQSEKAWMGICWTRKVCPTNPEMDRLHPIPPPLYLPQSSICRFACLESECRPSIPNSFSWCFLLPLLYILHFAPWKTLHSVFATLMRTYGTGGTDWFYHPGCRCWEGAKDTSIKNCMLLAISQEVGGPSGFFPL